jgi:hypothetical protein
VDGLYRDADAGFQVQLPPAAWIPTPLDGAALAFGAPDLRAGMALMVECKSPETGDLPAVASHLFFGLQEKRIQSRERFHLHDAPGVLTRLRGDLDGAPVEVEAVTLRRGGCLYDFVYVAPPAAFTAGHAAFQAFVESWTPLRAR